MVEENACDVPALEQQDHDGLATSSYRAGEASIRSAEERDRESLHHSAHRGVRMYRMLVLKLSKSGSGVWAPFPPSLDQIWKS